MTEAPATYGAAPAIGRSPREAWLEERRKHIGASDVAAILGVDPWRGPLAVYAAKVGGVDQADKRWMKFGRRLEGAIADWYSEDTGRSVVDLGAFEIQRHPDAPWLAATLDRLTAGSSAHPDPFGHARTFVEAPGTAAGPLECKAVAGFKAKEWREDPPLHYQVQLQAQLACTGAQWGSLAALIGGVALAWRDVQRNDKFIVAALPRLEAFWLRVQRRDPPPADALPGTSDAIRSLWAEESGETVQLDHTALQLVASWEASKLRIGAAKETADQLENQLRVLIGPATFAALPDGSYLTLKITERDGYEVKPTKYRTLRRWWPKVRRR